MTLCNRWHLFSCKTLPGRGVAIVGLAFWLAGCATGSIDDAVPLAEVESTAPTAELERSRIRNTGQFPNTNTIPEAATEQMSTEQKAAFLQDLKANQERQNRQAADPAAYQSEIERMQDLARDHGNDALEEIEKE